MPFDPTSVPSPAYVVDLGLLRKNLLILDHVQKLSGCKIILALKGFAMFSVFPEIRKYLCGTTASSVNEALLGSQEFKGEVHVYAPAYSDQDIEELLPVAHHITFNSMSQWQRYKAKVVGTKIKAGIRINPEHSEVKVKLYDPCAEYSRLGVTKKNFDEKLLDGISGLHFHTLCELGADALARTLPVVEEKFSKFFDRISWINFGGGHHITRPDYDTNELIALITQFKKRYPHLEVYLEPGEAIALGTGVLVATVLDVFHNGVDIAILDTSATAHMPDTLEMPYRAGIIDSGMPGEKKFTYRLGGLTCLSGDVIGDYSFDRKLAVGDKLVFTDMAHYTMVKNTTFNGVRLPAIAWHDPENGETHVAREFGYPDYRNRLS